MPSLIFQMQWLDRHICDKSNNKYLNVSHFNKPLDKFYLLLISFLYSTCEVFLSAPMQDRSLSSSQEIDLLGALILLGNLMDLSHSQCVLEMQQTVCSYFVGRGMKLDEHVLAEE